MDIPRPLLAVYLIDRQRPDFQQLLKKFMLIRFGRWQERRAGQPSHHRELTVEARNRPAITSLRLLAVLNVLSRSDGEWKSLLISVAPRYERAKLHPQKYASARRAARA